MASINNPNDVNHFKRVFIPLEDRVALTINELGSTIEECEGRLSANEDQGGAYNDGASAELKLWIEDCKYLLRILKGD